MQKKEISEYVLDQYRGLGLRPGNPIFGRPNALYLGVLVPEALYKRKAPLRRCPFASTRAIYTSFHPAAEKYVSKDSDQMIFHPTLFEVAACVRTRKNVSLPDRSFFKRVAELAAGRYRDVEFNA